MGTYRKLFTLVMSSVLAYTLQVLFDSGFSACCRWPPTFVSLHMRCTLRLHALIIHHERCPLSSASQHLRWSYCVVELLHVPAIVIQLMSISV